MKKESGEEERNEERIGRRRKKTEERIERMNEEQMIQLFNFVGTEIYREKQKY